MVTIGIITGSVDVSDVVDGIVVVRDVVSVVTVEVSDPDGGDEEGTDGIGDNVVRVFSDVVLVPTVVVVVLVDISAVVVVVVGSVETIDGIVVEIAVTDSLE